MKHIIRNDDKYKGLLKRKILALCNISVIRSNYSNSKIKNQTMNITFQDIILAIKRPAYFLATLSMIFAASSGVVEAAAVGGQVQYRSIKMSDNGVSGSAITTGVGSGTNVSYRVTFRAATSYTIKGVVLDFCNGTGGTPFIGDSTCAAPTDFTVGATPTISTADYVVGASTTSGLGTTANWTPTSINSGQTFEMTNSTGFALTSGTDYTFEISGITNPSDLGTFYARLITYVSDTGSIASYAHGTPGTYQDYGGFALSTANIVQITAKVQETMTFCVSGTTTAPTFTAPADCTEAVPAAITLGHGTNNTLDGTAIDTNTVYTYASTNALHGLTIRAHNSNACGGLSTDNGTTCAIPAVGAGAGVIGTIVAGTANFGMRCHDSTGGTGSVACDANYLYDALNTDNYGMDSTTSGTNVTTTYGDVLASSTAPVSGVSNVYDFAATASDTTPAGIYTANMALIATGTF